MRFTMLETIREAALEQLTASGEEATNRQRQTNYYQQLMKTASRQLMSEQQLSWLDRLEVENDNLRAVLGWTLHGSPEQVEVGVELAGGLGQFWWLRGYLAEGRRWLAMALAADQASLTVGRATALLSAGNLALSQGDYAAARDYHQQELTLERSLGNDRREAVALGNLGNVAQEEGDYATAKGYYLASLDMFRQQEDQWGVASTLGNLGNVAEALGKLDDAYRYISESEAAFRVMGYEWGIATSLAEMGNIARRRGDLAAASKLQRDSLQLRYKLTDRQGLASSLHQFALLAIAEGEAERIARLLGAEYTLRHESGVVRSPATQKEHDQIVEQVQAVLNQAEFLRLRTEGEAMSLDEVVAYALQEQA